MTPERLTVMICTAAILLSLHGTFATAKEPAVVFGAGTAKCEAFLDAHNNNPKIQGSVGVILSWVQGWLSARNGAPLSRYSPKTVGGSLSPETLKGFLVDECQEHPDQLVLIAADHLYDRFSSKGL